ncbi:MAG: aldo/keto reductase [Desulfobacterales bacterium]|nr:aldo/keto reductase [Desulfobacterales bacterium]
MVSASTQSARLVLGTAQLGMQYGVANRTGMPDAKAAVCIIAKAREGGICEFDTGQAYGESEMVLGRALKELGISDDVNIISKFHPDVNLEDTGEVRHSLDSSLSRLGIPRIFAMLLHREDSLTHWEKGLGKDLHRFVEEGLIEQVGISVYTPRNALQALKTDGIDLVQIPGNLLDRRFEVAGVYDEARSCGKSIYVRSILLQGLVLMNASELPSAMDFALPVIERLNKFSQDSGFTILQLAFGYVNGAYTNQKVVVGCETVEQMHHNLALWQTELPEDLITQIKNEFANTSERVLNPSLWHNRSKTE